MNDPMLSKLQGAATAFRAGDFAKALGEVEAVLARVREHPEALHLKALALGRMGRIEDAIVAYDATLLVHPQKAAVLANLGNALLSAGHAERSAEAYRRAIVHDAGFAPALLGLASAQRQLGDRAAAEATLRAVLQRQPRNADAWNLLGNILKGAQRDDEARAAYDAAIAIEPNHAPALVNRGALLVQHRDVPGALGDLTKAVALRPRLAEAHHQLANAQRSAGALAQAEASYKQALDLDPSAVEVHRDLANMLWECGRGLGFTAALDAAIGRLPNSEALLDLRAELATLAGDVQAAEAAARALAERHPLSPKGMMRLAKLRRASGATREAANFAGRAFALGSGDFEVRHEYAEALLADGKTAEAVRALDVDPPAEHLVRHFALKSIAMRAIGDPSYRRYYDYDRLTAKLFIDPPPDFPTIEAFNGALLAALLPLHAAQSVRPIKQTLYGGTQTLGRLWDEPAPAIQALKTELLKTAERYVDQLPDDPDHPFLKSKTKDLACAGAWSVMLRSGGGHVDHFHPKGWISACYYVRVPPEVAAGERPGYLRLGASGVSGLELPGELWLQPEEGAVIFFPSYMWHGVEPFEASTPRVTAPFDLAPR